MTLAICTTACGRSELTRRTFESFMKQNPGAQSLLRLMTLDHFSALEDQANAVAAAEFGWQTCAVAIPPRSGLMWGLRELVLEAARRGATQMLWLENDWECVRPLVTVPGIAADTDCVRLYYNQKQADGGRPAGTINMNTGLPIPWQYCGDHLGHAWESARAHFGGAPSIVDLACLLPFIDRPSMKEMSKAMGDVRTLRPRENYFWHIGHEGTPGFVH